MPAKKPSAPLAARNAGFAVRQRGLDWMVHGEDASVAVECQTWLDDYNPFPLLRLGALQILKSAALEMVDALISKEDQPRVISRRVELLGIPQKYGRPLTPEEQDEADQIDVLWEATKLVRIWQKSLANWILSTDRVDLIVDFNPDNFGQPPASLDKGGVSVVAANIVFRRSTMVTLDSGTAGAGSDDIITVEGG